MTMKALSIPSAPNSIQKGVPLNLLLDQEALQCLAGNLSEAYSGFDKDNFINDTYKDIGPLSLIERGKHIATFLKKYLPDNYSKAVEVLLGSLTPPLESTENNGLAVFFYLPHVSFVAMYGQDFEYNDGIDPFDVSMRAQYELTKRFSSEFSIRYFLIKQQQRTLSVLEKWATDPDPHVRRLCTEGTRPRLPWAVRIPSFIKDPSPALPLLEKLKNDDSLYVRRSVANHLGDIAKDHPELVLKICESWLPGASDELKWVIRHALRYPAKKGNGKAIDLRKSAG